MNSAFLKIIWRFDRSKRLYAFIRITGVNPAICSFSDIKCVNCFISALSRFSCFE